MRDTTIHRPDEGQPAMPIDTPPSPQVRYLTVDVSGIDIFYREAGPPESPAILLLHGFPTSSHMFRDLIPLLATRYRVVAPDYPGFGYSAMPDPARFPYTFDALAGVMEDFVDAVGLRQFVLYAQDFGGPVGFRIAHARPDQLRGLIVQNANAYEEGLSNEIQAILTRLYRERTPEMREQAAALFELAYTKRQFLEGVPDPTVVSPDAWQHAQWGMDRPGNKEVQYLMHADYASNFARYGEWHRYFRDHQPPTLIVWGRGDFVFDVAGAHAYRKDLPASDLHILETGHFALETHASVIAGHILHFMDTLDAGAASRCEPFSLKRSVARSVAAERSR
jgi:pimeloyl-ACP methyl ester carboxylesterase